MGTTIAADSAKKGNLYETPQGNVIKIGDKIEDEESVNYGKIKVTVMEGKDKGKQVAIKSDVKLVPHVPKEEEDDELEELPAVTSSKKEEKKSKGKAPKKEKEEKKSTGKAPKKEKEEKKSTTTEKSAAKKTKTPGKKKEKGNSQKQQILDKLTEAGTNGVTEKALEAIITKSGSNVKGDRLKYTVVYMVSHLRSGRYDGTKRKIIKEGDKYFLKKK